MQHALPIRAKIKTEFRNFAIFAKSVIQLCNTRTNEDICLNHLLDSTVLDELDFAKG